MAIPNAGPRPRGGSASCFCKGAAHFRPDHVDLFDGFLIDLVPHAELAARAGLAERLSLLANAPRGLVGQLAREDEITIAGPLLRRSPVIDEKTLIEIARMQGPGPSAGDVGAADAFARGLTDVIVRRGDRDTVRRAAGNAGALFSQAGYSTLIKRASHDGVLTLTVGQRADLSAPQLKDLLAGSIDIVRRRLFEVVKPGKAGGDQAGDERNLRRARAGREPPRLRAGAAHHPGAARRRRTQ